MSAVGYSIVTGGAIALAAATAKCVLGAKAHANSGLNLKKFKISSDGVTTTAVPILMELCYSTWATNAPGTNSSSVTPAQTYGRVLTAGFTAGKTWTAEPTVLTVLDEWLLPALMGGLPWEFSLGTEYDCALAEGFVLRFTAPAIVNVRASMDLERI